MEYTTQTLGMAIRRRRVRLGWSQRQLGEEAGYGEGAGVSISRIENGRTRPSPDKFASIAQALKVEIETLEREAARTANAQTRAASRPVETRSLRERVEHIQSTVNARSKAVTELANAFNAAHDRARDDFFMRFLETEQLIVGQKPSPPDPATLSDEDANNPEAAAEYRLRLSSSGVAKALGGLGGASSGVLVGGATAYTAFTAVAAWGTASTGAAISGLSGAAGTSAALAWFGGGSLAAGGAGVAGGTLVLLGIVVAPIALMAVGGFVWMARRSKERNAELLEKVQLAEEELRASEPGTVALKQAIVQATHILEEIAVHGARAQKRWAEQIGPLPVAWSDLNAEQQRKYLDFIDIAACQLTAANAKFAVFLTARGIDLSNVEGATMHDLKQAQATIEALV